MPPSLQLFLKRDGGQLATRKRGRHNQVSYEFLLPNYLLTQDPAISTWWGGYASRHVDSLPFWHNEGDIPSPSSCLLLSPPLSLETWVTGFCQPTTTSSLMIRVSTTTFPHLNCETEGSCLPPPPFLSWNVRRRVPAHHCWLSFDVTRRGNPLRHVCLFSFDTMRRENPPRHVCLFLFDAMRRGNPLRRIYLTLFDVTRGKTLPLASVWSHSMWWGGFALPIVSISYSMTPLLHLHVYYSR